MNIIVILSSGVGARFGGPTPKQYLMLDGREVLSYVIESAKASKKVDLIVVVANDEYCALINKNYGVETIEGGSTRNISFRNAVDYIKKNYKCEKVVVLDAVRPFITSDLIDLYFDKLNEYDICVTSSKITDSLCCLDMPTCDRSRYFLTASPMSFRFAGLDKYLDANSQLVEVLQMYPADTKIYYHYDFKDNYKITYPEDLVLIKCLMEVRKKQV